MARLSKTAREYFRACGRRGGAAGDPSTKGFANPVLREAVAEINRTRRTVAKHDDGCWCDHCRRYFMAKQKIKQVKENK